MTSPVIKDLLTTAVDFLPEAAIVAFFTGGWNYLASRTKKKDRDAYRAERKIENRELAKAITDSTDEKIEAAKMENKKENKKTQNMVKGVCVKVDDLKKSQEGHDVKIDMLIAFDKTTHGQVQKIEGYLAGMHDREIEEDKLVEE